jgi:hypothetical protein
MLPNTNVLMQEPRFFFGLLDKTMLTSGLTQTALAELCDSKTAQPRFEIISTSARARWP